MRNSSRHLRARKYHDHDRRDCNYNWYDSHNDRSKEDKDGKVGGVPEARVHGQRGAAVQPAAGDGSAKDDPLRSLTEPSLRERPQAVGREDPDPDQSGAEQDLLRSCYSRESKPTGEVGYNVASSSATSSPPRSAQPCSVPRPVPQQSAHISSKRKGTPGAT